MSAFHIHFTFSENSGEIRRIKNINKDLVQKLSDEVYEIAFVAFRELLQKDGERFKLHTNVCKKYYLPLFPFSYRSCFFKHVNIFWCSLCVLILWLFHKPKYVVAEFSTGWQALKFLPSSVKCIIDVHGATREEYEYSSLNYNPQMAKTFDYIERKGMDKATFVVCQSEAMKKHLLQKYSFLSGDVVYSYKCGADGKIFYIDENIRLSYRDKLGIAKNELLFIYSGGLHAWQRIEDSINYFVKYASMQPAKFLILTLDKVAASNLLNKYDDNIRDRVLIMSTTNDEVYKYLNAADVAFLLRDDVILNQVASPTKLAEYMFCGLPIISTSVSKYWVDADFAMFNVEDRNIMELQTFVVNSNRKLISDYAKKYLSLECDRKQIMELLYKVTSH